MWIYPETFFLNSLTANSIIFLTNNHKIQYGSSQSTVGVNWTGTVYTNTFNFNSGDNFSGSNWNHLILVNDLQVTTTNYYASFANNLYQSIGSQSSLTPLTNIYFCNVDSSIPVCTGNWINAYYKQLRIWDGNWTNMMAVLQVNY